MAELPKEEVKEELLKLSKQNRKGPAARRPILSLEPEWSPLLRTVPDSVLPPDANRDDRKRAAIALLEWIVAKSTDKDVLAAGDMLGLTELDETEVQAWLDEYWADHPGDKRAPKKPRYARSRMPARYARAMRLLIVAHHRFQMTINGLKVKEREPEWISALVDELYDLVANEKELAGAAEDLGLVQEPDNSASSGAVPATVVAAPDSASGHSTATLPKPLSAHWVVEKIRHYRARYHQFEENLDPVERTLVKLLRAGLAFATLSLLALYLTSVLLAYLTQEFIPVPSVEPLRAIFEFLYGFDLVIVCAIFVSVGIVVLLSQLAKSSRVAKKFYHVTVSGLLVATTLAGVGLIYFDHACRNSVASEKEEFSGALNEMRSMRVSDVESFAGSSRCDDLRRDNVAGLRQCDVADGALRLAANRDQDIEVVTYPRGNLRENLQDLSGDFFASTRLRSADGTALSDCAMLISEPSRNYERYFHLVYRPEDRYPGYGAEFVSRTELLHARKGAQGSGEIYAASQATLPYVGIVNAHENDDGWIDLTVTRRGTKYQLFVNERLIGEYVGAVANAANVYLAAINGGSNTGGTVNCHFGNLEIYARPRP